MLARLAGSRVTDPCFSPAPGRGAIGVVRRRAAALPRSRPFGRSFAMLAPPRDALGQRPLPRLCPTPLPFAGAFPPVPMIYRSRLSPVMVPL